MDWEMDRQTERWTGRLRDMTDRLRDMTDGLRDGQID